MRSMLNVVAVLAFLGLVMGCNLLTGDEGSSSGNQERQESTAPGESGGAGSAAEEGPVTEESNDPGKDEKDSLTKTTKVQFAKGKTSRSYNSSILKGGTHTFTLGASKGQDMDVEISSKKNNAAVKVFDPAGKPVANDGSAAIFSANLPATGTYKIVVSSDGGDDSFTIDFIVAGGEKAEPGPPTQGGLTKTVKFSKGRSSASYEDAVLLGTRNNYLLGAQAGQVMSVNISSLENNAVFQIRGPGGYLSGAEPGTDKRSWSGQLPANGKYTVIVGSTRGNATYTVTLAIR